MLLLPCCDVIMTLTQLQMLHIIADTPRKELCKFESDLTDGFGDIDIFVTPMFA